MKENVTVNYDALDIYTIETVNVLPVKAKEIRLETSKNPYLSKIVEALEKGNCLKKLRLQNHKFALSNGILLRKDRMVRKF